MSSEYVNSMQLKENKNKCFVKNVQISFIFSQSYLNTKLHLWDPFHLILHNILLLSTNFSNGMTIIRAFVPLLLLHTKVEFFKPLESSFMSPRSSFVT